MERFYRLDLDEKIRYALLVGDEYRLIEGDIFEDWQISDKIIAPGRARILAPCLPKKIVCLGLNYRDHAAEVKVELPREPLLFMKPQTSVIGPDEEIVWPNHLCRRLDYEAELAIVIGEKCKDIEKEQAFDYIFGFTCANDVTARDLQPKHGQWTLSKSFDTFCPLGPALVRGVDCGNLSVSCRLNGVEKQRSNTRQLIFDIPGIVSYISKVMTLEPEDVILTGTPSGISGMKDGDVVEVEIENIGILSNTVRAKYPQK